MKFTIRKEILMDALNKVSKAISSRNIIPVLAGIKFDLTKKKLTLTASDNDITIQTFIECNDEDVITVKEEGSIIIQGKYILDIVRKLPDKFINIEVVDELKILIYTENSEFNLNGISEREYPNIDLGESKNHIELSARVIKDIVNQTSFATSIDENKAILNGINFNINSDILECNATDSYRLARKIIKLSKASKENQNIVIPSKNLVEFTRIIEDTDDLVEIHIFNNKVLFKYQSLLFQSRLINGSYPNTSNLLPKDYLVKLHFNINQFYDVVDRVSILTSDKDKNVVTLETDGNNLIMKSSSAEIGRVEEKMQITKDNDIDVKVSFSSKYMMDALKSFNTLDVELYFVGEIKPIILKSSGDETLTQLVLPIRTY